ncbi:MAG: putative 5'(3')-deoxyribonucleotidase [Saprospiraceae bacterium]|nr:MAG: putative 5'(3')-deoxyribonucleotidase [Saprospiraceae bacterium]
MMRKRIAIDMDEVIADVTPKFLDLYEDRYGKRLKREEYWGKKIYQINGAVELRETLQDKGFFADLPVIPESQEGIRELMEHYDVFITTAAMEFRSSFEDKYDWLKVHFPFIHWKNIVFCGDKSILRAEYMIDDHAKNLRTFQGKGLLYTATHNIHETEFTRVNNWAEVMAFFRKELAV